MIRILAGLFLILSSFFLLYFGFKDSNEDTSSFKWYNIVRTVFGAIMLLMLGLAVMFNKIEN